MIGNGEMQEHKELNYLTTFKVNNCSGVIAHSYQLNLPLISLIHINYPMYLLTV